MDTVRLEYFLRVVELGSINRAAADLHLSQPALSRHLQQLESEVGASLLVRGPKGVTLTDAGAHLADRARGLLRDLATLREEVSGVARGQVAIGFPHAWRHIATTRLAADLVDSRFIAARVTESTGHDLRRQLREGLLDACVAADDGRVEDGLQRVPLARDALVVVGAPQTVDAAAPVGLERLSELPLILLARPNPLRTELEHVVGGQGLALDVVLEPDALAVCLDLVARRKGFTVVPGCALVGAEGALSWAPVAHLHTDWALYLNVRRLHSEAVRHCAEQVVRITREAVDGGWWPGASASDVEHQPR